jgi:hypothetical protein
MSLLSIPFQPIDEENTAIRFAPDKGFLMLRKAVALCLVFNFSLADAETFKCTKPGGASYYSDAPCGGDKTVRVEQTLGSTSNGVTNQKLLGKMLDLCKKSIPDWIPYKDPGTLTFRDSPKLTGKYVVMTGAKAGPQQAIRMILNASSKSSAGRYSYSGMEDYFCYLSPSEMPTVLGIYTKAMEN